FLFAVLKNNTNYQSENISKLGEAKSRDSILPGKRLALKYCTLCHLFPEPSLLDKKTWINNVLPNMGLRLGIRESKDPYADLLPEEQPVLKKMNVYPAVPLINKDDWKKIVQYFEHEAP